MLLLNTSPGHPPGESEVPLPGNSRQLVMLLFSLVVCYGAAGFGAAQSAASIRDWYPTLRKPVWTPPNWVFGPVWTVLYGLMAVAAWLVWRRAGWRRGRTALGLFAVQLLLNAAWSTLFFNLHSPGMALADIIVLWAAIAATLWSFGRISVVAGGLFVPYLLWVSYAAALNWAICRMNL